MRRALFTEVCAYSINSFSHTLTCWGSPGGGCGGSPLPPGPGWGALCITTPKHNAISEI